AEAPAHSGGLVRLAFGTTSAVLSTTALGLAEQARFAVEEHVGLIAALNAPDTELGDEFLATSDSEGQLSTALAAALAKAGKPSTHLKRALKPIPALLLALHGLGLKSAEQMQVAWVSARFPVAAAEAMAVPPGSFREYP